MLNSSWNIRLLKDSYVPLEHCDVCKHFYEEKGEVNEDESLKGNFLKET